jgi:F-type H+-transporting ATPase subunit b
MDFNGTFLATIVTFILFVFIMNKILYAPILGIMEKRKTLIAENYQAAKDNDSKRDEITAEREEKLNIAKDDARSKYNDKIAEFKDERNQKIVSAQEEAKSSIENSKIELGRVSDEVKDKLKGSMTDLAEDIVEKVIGYRSEVGGFDNDVVSSVLWGDK